MLKPVPCLNQEGQLDVVWLCRKDENGIYATGRLGAYNVRRPFRVTVHMHCHYEGQHYKTAAICFFFDTDPLAAGSAHWNLQTSISRPSYMQHIVMGWSIQHPETSRDIELNPRQGMPQAPMLPDNATRSRHAARELGCDARQTEWGETLLHGFKTSID